MVLIWAIGLVWVSELGVGVLCLVWVLWGVPGLGGLFSGFGGFFRVGLVRLVLIGF